MKKYRLKQWYPSLPKWVEIGAVARYIKMYECYFITNYTIQVSEVENNPNFWELIEEEKSLFVTEDGVEVFSDIDNLFAINLTYFSKTQNTLRSSSWLIDNPSYKVFSLESNADEYIWKNKPLFSYEDFIRYGDVPYERVIELLAKERVEE